MAKAKRVFRVLFWVSPITELQSPLQKRCWVRVFIPRLIEAFQDAVGAIESTFVLSEDLLHAVESEHAVLPGRAIAIRQHDLLDGYRLNALQLMKRAQRGLDMPAENAHFRKLLVGRLEADYVPDVVFAFGTAPFLRETYREAQIFHHEYSVFSRAPYPETLALDPMGTGYRFTLANRAGLLNEIAASGKEIAALDGYRTKVMAALTANSHVGSYFDGLRRRFRHILLLPLGYEDFYETLIRLPHQGQFEVVEHVLDSVDEQTCVIVTQHPVRRAVSPEGLAELKRLHPNLETQDWFSAVPCFSQVALAYVDACAYLNTSLAYQAAFLGCRMISLDGFCDGIADGIGFQSIQSVFSSNAKDRANFIVWSLRHHAASVRDLGTQLAANIRAGIGRLTDYDDVATALPAFLTSVDLCKRLGEWGELARDFGRQLIAVGKPQTVESRMRQHVADMEVERESLFADRDRIAADRDGLKAKLEEQVAERESLLAKIVSCSKDIERLKARCENELLLKEIYRRTLAEMVQERNFLVCQLQER